MIQRPTEAEALEQLEAIIAGADPKIVQAFADQVKHAGASTAEKIGMWANSITPTSCNPTTASRPGCSDRPN